MLAANRTDKVIGRMIFLVSSINTIKGAKNIGVPCGTRWARTDFTWTITLRKFNPIHATKLRVKVKIIWEEAVKM